MTALLIDFLLVSTPILAAGLLLSHVYRQSVLRDRILFYAVFAAFAATLLRFLIVPVRRAPAQIVTQHVPVDLIGLGWIALALAMLIRLLILHWYFFRRMAIGRRLAAGPWADALGVAAGSTAVSVVTVSDRFSSPFCFGSTICIPDWMVGSLGEGERESVLAHELEHLRRDDARRALFMDIVCAVFFPQPLLFLVRRQIQIVSEERADGAAVARVGSGQPLARVLLQVSQRISRQQPRLALWNRQSPLVRRVRKIVGEAGSAQLSRLAIPLQIAVAIAALLAVPAIALIEPTLPPLLRAALRPADDVDSVGALMRVLRSDESEQVRYAAADSLRHIGDSRALPALREAATHDSSPQVRAAASQAVTKIER